MPGKEVNPQLADGWTARKIRGAGFWSKVGPWLRRSWDLLALLLLVLASIPSVWLSPGSLVIVDHPALTDHSWILDACFKASRGLWLGRDVAFTYGPLYQWLSCLPADWTGHSMGAVHATYNVLPVWCSLLATYLTLRLLVPEQAAWKRAALLLVLCILWSPLDLRTSAPVLLFALFLRGWYEVQEQRINPYLLGAGSALLCVLAFLYATNCGLYAAVAWFLALGGVLFEQRSEPRALPNYLAGLAAFIGAALVFSVAINAIFGRPTDFFYWKESLAIVSAYRWIEPYPIATTSDGVRVLAPLLLCGMVFLIRVLAGKGSNLVAARSGFLLGAFVFGVAYWQTALVRSDFEHIVIGIFPLLLFPAVVLVSFKSRTASAAGFIFIFACSWFAAPPRMFLPASIEARYEAIGRPVLECPGVLSQFDGTCYPMELTSMLQSGADFIDQFTSSRDSIAVFPYQTIFGIASRRTVASGIMQSYLVSGERLSSIEIAGLNRDRPQAAIYLPDADLHTSASNDLSLMVDGVPNFTRSPEVWFWMFRHFRLEQRLSHGLLGLRRDELRAAGVSERVQDLGVPASTCTIRDRISLCDIGDLHWPAEPVDFLRLRLKVQYPLWWRLRKPERLMLEITRDDGSVDLEAFLVAPDVITDAWFYPWKQSELSAYFERDAGKWRNSLRPNIVHLRLLATPFDYVSVAPTHIQIDRVDVLTYKAH